jgi:hypothetical protein
MQLGWSVVRGGLGATHDGDSAGGRDCTNRPAGLSEGVSEHLDRGLCVKDDMKCQSQRQLTEGRLMW